MMENNELDLIAIIPEGVDVSKEQLNELNNIIQTWQEQHLAKYPNGQPPSPERVGQQPSPYPDFGEDWRKRWVYFGNHKTLHRVAQMDDEDWEADGLIPIGGMGVTACGWRARLSMPGFLSRMGLKRCNLCCKLTGVKQGEGAPFNDKTLSEEEKGR